MADIETVRSTVLQIAQCLVDTPGSVSVEQEDRDGSSLFRIRVAKGESGQMIGRQGRIARSLRVFVSAAAQVNRTKIILDIVDI